LLITIFVITSIGISISQNSNLQVDKAYMRKHKFENDTPLIADWPYPRHDISNTAASTTFNWQLLEQPIELWQVPAPEGYIYGSFFPVAADIDNDGKIEYLIGVTNFYTQPRDCWLYAFNIEDGSILWKKQFDSYFYWSAPIIVDVNNDNQLDIVLATKLQVIALNGNDASVIWAQFFPAAGMGMNIDDVDNDGYVEVVINDYGDPKKIYLLNGQNGNIIWQRETWGSAYNIPTMGDINGDGYSEILSHSHLYDPSRERLLVWDKDGNELWTYLATPSPEQEAHAPAELGWVPDFGYISTTIDDFDSDGELEIGWGTRCHYYLHNNSGDLIWRVPTVEGYGIWITHRSDGTVVPDIHGTGGPSGYSSAVGNIDSDSALEIVLSFKSEYRGHWYESNDSLAVDKVTPANKIWALDGKDGMIQWIFEGEYSDEDSIEYMWEPILVDLTGDSLLDVLSISTDGHIYAVQGNTGDELMSYSINVPQFWYAVHLTFVGNNDKGILLYGSIDETVSPPLYTLHTLQIAQLDQQVYVEDDKDYLLPNDLIITQNYPNPFNSTTFISYYLPKSDIVNISVFNIKGELIETLINKQNTKGWHTVIWKAETVSTGVYFYKIITNEYTYVRKCLVIK